jgi:hypothetical protein
VNFSFEHTGDFENSWPLYESRWSQIGSKKRTFRQAQWNGCQLEGKRVLVYAEQGVGDAIQFIRYAPLIARRGGAVVLECHASLVSLFRSAKGVSEVFAAGEQMPEFDLHIPMLSLPLLFRTKANSIPAEIPYLATEFGTRTRGPKE